MVHASRKVLGNSCTPVHSQSDLVPINPRPLKLIGRNENFSENEKAFVHRCAQISVLLKQGKYMTNVRIVFYVTTDEKAALTKISKQTGAPASELMRRALKQWLKGQKG
jgi:hypothetical protein